jgi:hypothetical protein
MDGQPSHVSVQFTTTAAPAHQPVWSTRSDHRGEMNAMSATTAAVTTGTTTVSATRTAGHRAARAGLWALPAYGLLLGLSTVTHQPPVSDFDAYARYVATDVFLLSHLGASIFGAGLAILGAVAVAAHLVPGRAARTATIGLTLTVITNVFMAAAFGSAAFV